MESREYDIKPKQTLYKKIMFRSRLEANWAVFFDALEIKWEYEPKTFFIDEVCKGYIPDFFITIGLDWQAYIEIKPSAPIELEIVKLESVKKQTLKECEFCVNYPFFDDSIALFNRFFSKEELERASNISMDTFFPLSVGFMKGLEKLRLTYEDILKWKYYGGDSGAHLAYYQMLEGKDTELPPHSDTCICGHSIKYNCYLSYEDEIIILGRCCIEKFNLDFNRYCENCGDKHNNRKNNLCTECSEYFEYEIKQKVKIEEYVDRGFIELGIDGKITKQDKSRVGFICLYKSKGQYDICLVCGTNQKNILNPSRVYHKCKDCSRRIKQIRYLQCKARRQQTELLRRSQNVSRSFWVTEPNLT